MLLRIRTLKSDPDPVKSRPDPQHWKRIDNKNTWIFCFCCICRALDFCPRLRWPRYRVSWLACCGAARWWRAMRPGAATRPCPTGWRSWPITRPRSSPVSRYTRRRRRRGRWMLIRAMTSAWRRGSSRSFSLSFIRKICL